jgi:hypothetical protein
MLKGLQSRHEIGRSSDIRGKHHLSSILVVRRNSSEEGSGGAVTMPSLKEDHRSWQQNGDLETYAIR